MDKMYERKPDKHQQAIMNLLTSWELTSLEVLILTANLYINSCLILEVPQEMFDESFRNMSIAYAQILSDAEEGRDG